VFNPGVYTACARSLVEQTV